MKIEIKDLDMNKELDKKAMSELVGGKAGQARLQSLSMKAERKKWLANKKRYSLG